MDNKNNDGKTGHLSTWTEQEIEDHEKWLANVPYVENFDELEWDSEHDMTPDAKRPDFLC